MKRLPKNITRDTLLKLPVRDWQKESEYDFVYIVPTRKKHDSGYSLIALVGVNLVDKGQVGEIAGHCDDIGWAFSMAGAFIREGKMEYAMRTDCLYPSGIFRMWGSKCRFRIGCSVSSTDVTVVRPAKALV